MSTKQSKKRGRPLVTVRAEPRSISLYPDEWDKLDRIRGELSRGRWIARQLETETHHADHN